ncbi:MAG: carboxypeptidase-like regulatory domain-containing protein, partial [Balneolaceae bacterium]|nr:carboxypeptidase-like regulatory domain-containing protein [Balneolaceae bacterium]
YHRINMTINKANIKNPLLVPDLDEFSIVTDPNQYKPINIPFFVSGVIEGRVTRLTPNGRQPLAGLRLYLDQQDGPFEKEMQTFSDGSFYAYEVPPGDYTLRVDSTQLAFLEARARPDKINFEVETTAEGDFVENLNFSILPRDTTGLIVEKRTEEDTVRPDTTKTKQLEAMDPYHYQVQMASYASADWAQRADGRAEQLFPGENFFIRYNPVADLYGLRTPPLGTRQQAIDHALRFMKSDFKEPAIVATKDTTLTSTDLYPKFVIVLDTVDTQSRAQASARRFEEAGRLETRIMATPDSARFVIQSFPFSSRQKALLTLGDIRNLNMQPDPDRSYAVIEQSHSGMTGLTFAYTVEIVGLNKKEALQLYDLISGEEDFMPKGATLEREGRRISFEGINSWKNTIALKRRLDKVLVVGTPVIIMRQFEAAPR